MFADSTFSAVKDSISTGSNAGGVISIVIVNSLFHPFYVVHHVDSSWNHIESSLTLLYEKLVQLGFVYYNGEIQIIEPEIEEGQYHARSV